MVITSLQCQLRNMKCSEEDDLREYLDKAQDIFARFNEMGAKMENQESLDIILVALPPSYELVMNALTTSLEEVGKPIETTVLLGFSSLNMTERNLCRLLKKNKDS